MSQKLRRILEQQPIYAIMTNYFVKVNQSEYLNYVVKSNDSPQKKQNVITSLPSYVTIMRATCIYESEISMSQNVYQITSQRRASFILP